MDNRLSLNEARHMLSDFFEIHADESEKSALERAVELLDEMGANDRVVPAFGSLATIRVGDSVLAYLPESYDPKDIYLVRRKTSEKEKAKRVSLR